MRRGNTSKSDIQHVWVEDDGLGGSTVDFSIDPRDCAPLTVTYTATAGPLDGVSPVYQQISFDGGTSWTNEQMSGGANVWSFTNAMPTNATSAIVWFQNSGNTLSDNNDGANWSTSIRDCDAAVFSNGVSINPAVPTAGQSVTIAYDPAGRNLASATNVNIHYGYNHSNWTDPPGVPMAKVESYWVYSYTIPTAATSIVMVFNDGSVWDNNNTLNWTFPVNPYVATVPDGVVITNPVVSTSTVAFAVSNTMVQGTAGTNLTGSLAWTNSGTGASGSLGMSTYWSQSVDLAVGDNHIRISAAIAGGGASTAMVTLIREAYVPPVADGVAITNPAASTVTVVYAVSNYAVKGTAGTNLTGGLSWTNAAMAQGGGFAHASRWTQNVDLAVGENVVTVSGVIAGTGASTATNADDSAAAYGESWTHGSNEGTGFGAWSLSGSSNAGTFASADGWGFWSHEGGNQSQAIRPFSTPLSTGQTFSVFMQNGWIWESGGSIGFALRDEVGSMLWELYFNGGDTFYKTPDGATDIGWTDAGLDIFFTVTGTTNFSVEVHPVGGSARQYNGTFTGSIADFRAWSSDNGTEDGQNSNRDYFIDNLKITHPVAGSESNSTATVHILREPSGNEPPMIDDIEIPPGGGMQITITNSIPGAQYAVFSSPMLIPTQNWLIVSGTATNGTGGTIDLSITNDLLQIDYYRVGYTLP